MVIEYTARGTVDALPGIAVLFALNTLVVHADMEDLSATCFNELA
jgi:hypothetical protein